MNHYHQPLNRRTFLRGGLYSTFTLSLRAAITGLPASFLLNGRTHAMSNSIKYTILSCSPAGEAINVNGPGTYDEKFESIIEHPKESDDADSEVSVLIGDNPEPYTMSHLENSTRLSLGNQEVTLAQCYDALKPELRNHLVWFNHRTMTNAHPEFSSVLKLHGALRGNDGRGSEMLSSAIAYDNSMGLGTTLNTPFVINGNHTADGIPLTKYAPKTIKSLVNSGTNIIGGKENFDEMYDFMIDEIYKKLKQEGNPKKLSFLDQHASNRREAALLGDELASLLTNIDDNSPQSELNAALAIFKLKLSPLVVVRHNFSDDNHADTNLANECKQTLNMIKSLNAFHDLTQTATYSLDREVCYATMDVFGRTVKRNGRGDGQGGRNHLGQFTSGLIFSPSIKGGLVGGIEISGKKNDNISATGIDSETGQSKTENPDIDGNSTLAAYMKTIMKTAGVSDERCDARIPDGKIIKSIFDS